VVLANLEHEFQFLNTVWILQGGLSRIFQTLGADVDSIPGLWIAAPLTGLLVQPIGCLSYTLEPPFW
jgi:maltose/moltooligosaccharide transporter